MIPDPNTEPLFNISYGVDKLTEPYNEGYFDGMWITLPSWDKLDNITKQTYIDGLPCRMFIIDPTADFAHLIDTTQLASSYNLILPLCKIDEGAGIGVFTPCKTSSPTSPNLLMNQCIVIIGDFSKFGQQRGEGYNVYGVNLDTVL